MPRGSKKLQSKSLRDEQKEREEEHKQKQSSFSMIKKEDYGDKIKVFSSIQGGNLINMPITVSNESSHKFNFKRKNWSSRFRLKEKNSRSNKNLKNLLVDSLDNFTYNQYQSLEVGPSILPKKKFCDITGFETTYHDPRSGMRYFNSDIYKLIQNLPDPIKNQYLSIRKALFLIK